jgi:aspartate racemase
MGKDPKKLGVVGGTSPESTLDYYRLLVDRYRERATDGSYPSIIINSIDFKPVVDAFRANDLASVTNQFADAVEVLARAGADVGLFAANTPHVIFDDVARRSKIPLISIVRAASDAAKAAGHKRLGLLGTRFTMQGTFYPEVFDRAGIAIVPPKSEEREWVHEIYMGELVEGVFLPETRARLLTIVDRLREEEHVDGVLLAGTEIPLILRDAEGSVPLLDTSRIHVDAAVEALLRD